LNLVELLFNELRRRQLRRLTVHSVAELIVALTTHLNRRNEEPTCSPGPHPSDPFS